MSTFMNYTFQSFNFRLRQGARPFYDLVANIAAEEFGHIELVAAAINTMLTGAGEKGDLPKPADLLNPQQIIAGGAAALCQDSNGKPWNGDYITSTGDLVEDLVHNFFLETGARNNKLKVYEMVEHPAARALTSYLLVRGGVHQIAYARAPEPLTGADTDAIAPVPRIPTNKIPECKRRSRMACWLRHRPDPREVASDTIATVASATKVRRARTPAARSGPPSKMMTSGRPTAPSMTARLSSDTRRTGGWC
jgi:Mn-containing catalase